MVIDFYKFLSEVGRAPTQFLPSPTIGFLKSSVSGFSIVAELKVRKRNCSFGFWLAKRHHLSVGLNELSQVSLLTSDESAAFKLFFEELDIYIQVVEGGACIAEPKQLNVTEMFQAIERMEQRSREMVGTRSLRAVVDGAVSGLHVFSPFMPSHQWSKNFSDWLASEFKTSGVSRWEELLLDRAGNSSFLANQTFFSLVWTFLKNHS